MRDPPSIASFGQQRSQREYADEHREQADDGEDLVRLFVARDQLRAAPAAPYASTLEFRSHQ